MIRLVSENYIKQEYLNDFYKLANILKENSLKENGILSYDFYQDIDDIKHITFIEKWKNEKSINIHMEMDYFISFIEKTKDMFEISSKTTLYKELSLGFNEFEAQNFSQTPKEIKDYPFLIVSNDNSLVNAMTANWGMLGNMWNYPTFLSVVRRTRFTKKLIDNSKYFSVCFFEGYKKELGYLGTVSGFDKDKIKEVGFTIDYCDDVPYIKEAKEVLILEKNFNMDMNKDTILDESVLKDWYTKDIDNDNFHTIYFGKIIKHLKR